MPKKKLSEHDDVVKVPVAKAAAIGQYLRRFFQPGKTFEIRIFEAQEKGGRIVRGNYTVNGYYDDVDAAVADLLRVDSISAFVGWNPIDPKKLATARSVDNTLRLCRTGEGVSAEQVLRLDRLCIDVDAIKPQAHRNDSATDEERAEALETLDRILADFPEIKNAVVAYGSSGNGAYAAVNLGGLANTAPNRMLVARCIHGLKALHPAVDTKTSDASRVGTIAATPKCKGVPSEERPWRLGTVMKPSEGFTPAVFDIPNWLAKHAEAPPVAKKVTKKGQASSKGASPGITEHLELRITESSAAKETYAIGGAGSWRGE